MDFFEPIKQGILGLLLFTGNFFLPASDNAALTVVSVRQDSAAFHVTIKMELPLNRQLEELIDAGVPLNFQFTAATGSGDTVGFVRSLRCDVGDLTYSYSDSSKSGVVRSRKYPMVLLALRDFTRWEFNAPPGAGSGTAEVAILHSRVSQLNRSVDMSRVWGHQRVKTSFALKGTEK